MKPTRAQVPRSKVSRLAAPRFAAPRFAAPRFAAPRFAGPALLLAAALLGGCKAGAIPQGEAPMTASTASDLGALAGGRVFFGHQSVGEDILNGLRDLLAEPGAPAVAIAPAEALPGVAADSLPERGYILHAKVGQNTKPDSKCADFARILEAVKDRVDAAVLKYCYVDVTSASDAVALADAYHAQLESLRARFPSLAIIPSTVPLTVSSDRPDWRRKQIEVDLRRMVGFYDRNDADNLKRAAFNDRLREKYAGKPLLDLARLQSTHPDGRREGFQKGSVAVPSLIPAWTHDGGHLNEEGRKAVARGFARTLAEALAGTRTAAVR